LVIQSLAGDFMVPALEPSMLGSQKQFVIAADRVLITPSELSTNDYLQGTVIGLEFVGATQTVFVDIEGVREFKVQKQQHELDSLGIVPGRKVSISWQPEHTWLLPESA
jgi:spermidine/putrescine transport system ATP-binding protein